MKPSLDRSTTTKSTFYAFCVNHASRVLFWCEIALDLVLVSEDLIQDVDLWSMEICRVPFDPS